MNGTTSKGPIVATAAACTLGLAGITAALLLAFAAPAGAHHAAPVVPSGPSTIQPSAPTSPTNPNTPANHITPSAPVTPPAAPSASIEAMQRELGQLNYYEGPVNGLLTPQTVQSIKYLQRDCDLPQTGYFDQVTYLGLQRMLVTGNNQMAG
jgi:peptidoglycan hydrolase-like protein with peptidoglycan-binding domain